MYIYIYIYSSGNNASDDSEQVGAEISPPEPETTVQTSRYLTRQRRNPPASYIANAAKCSTDITVTTSDEPTLGEAMSATPEEREMWLSVIDNEFDSWDSKQTWQLDHSPKEQTLPAHVVLKVKRRKSDGTVERFKARIVAGGNFQTYGEDYFETYAPLRLVTGVGSSPSIWLFPAAVSKGSASVSAGESTEKVFEASTVVAF